MRLRADFETRSLSYILINQPSLVPYQDFPAGAAGRLGAVRRRSASTTLRAHRLDRRPLGRPRAAGDLHAAGGRRPSRGRSWATPAARSTTVGDHRRAQRRRLLDPAGDGRAGARAARGADLRRQDASCARTSSSGSPSSCRSTTRTTATRPTWPRRPTARRDVAAPVQPSQPARLQPDAAGALLNRSTGLAGGGSQFDSPRRRAAPPRRHSLRGPHRLLDAATPPRRGRAAASTRCSRRRAAPAPQAIACGVRRPPAHAATPPRRGRWAARLESHGACRARPAGIACGVPTPAHAATPPRRGRGPLRLDLTGRAAPRPQA